MPESEKGDAMMVAKGARNDHGAPAPGTFDKQETACRNFSDVSADRDPASHSLSVRAENVLKELAVELTGEHPPQDGWIPSDLLLERLTFKHISTARNCGPQTTAEIIKWAHAKGRVIRPSFHVGKSLSAMWREATIKFSAGELSKAEIAEALENSARRRNTRIPVEFQLLLLQLIKSSKE
jgi:hypothetical protein